MRVIITSDTHQNRKEMLKIAKFAKDNGIDTILDAGDLHGDIDVLDGLQVFAVYWKYAKGRMREEDFYEDIAAINGTVVDHGSIVRVGNASFLMTHDLIGRDRKISEDVVNAVSRALEGACGKKHVLFGHTHTPHLLVWNGVIMINPGEGGKGFFVVLDTDEGVVEYRNVEKVFYRYDNHSYGIIGFRGIKLTPLEFAHISLLEGGGERLHFGSYFSEIYDEVLSLRTEWRKGVPCLCAYQVLDGKKKVVVDLE